MWSNAAVAGLCFLAHLSLSSALALSKERPVMKVVRLLEDMKAQLEKEAADDEAVYEQIACWCETNRKEKTQAVELAEARVEDLQSEHGEFAGKVEELKTIEAATTQKLRDDQAALDQATEMRMKEGKAFHLEETDLLQAIQACKQAIVVLSKHHATLAQIKAVAKSVGMLQTLRVASHAMSRSRAAVLKAFLTEAEEESATVFRRVPGFQSYAPQSGQVLGILKQMQEDFEGDLSDSQKGEQKAKEDYESLKAAKESEIAAGKKQLEQVSRDLADFREKLAGAWEEMEDLREQIRVDKQFLENLRRRCDEGDREYEKRKASRQAELAAVQDTIAYLNSDEAFETFDKTMNTALLQTSAGDVARRQRAVAALRRAGTPQLLMLATSAQLDSFEKVKAAIDKLVAELLKQQEEEVKHRDWCIEEINTNNRTTEATVYKKDKLEAHIEATKKTIEDIKKEIEDTTKAVAETEEQMKRASETREAENADFQETVTDARLTYAILQKALERMKKVYFLQEDPGAPHIQTSGNATDPGNAPARFTKYEKHAGGATVVSMLEKLVLDAQVMEESAVKDERFAQRDYEGFMIDSNEAIAAYKKSIVDLTAKKAQSEEELAMQETDLKQTEEELDSLASVLTDLRNSCDFALDNFAARQEARAREIDALKEAKAYLSGMK